MELVNLSRSLIHRLNDRALTPQHSGYDTLKRPVCSPLLVYPQLTPQTHSQLTEIEGLLEGWLTYGFLKRFCKSGSLSLSPRLIAL